MFDRKKKYPESVLLVWHRAPVSNAANRTKAPLAQDALCQTTHSRIRAPLAQDSRCQTARSCIKGCLAQGPVPKIKVSLAQDPLCQTHQKE